MWLNWVLELCQMSYAGCVSQGGHAGLRVTCQASCSASSFALRSPSHACTWAAWSCPACNGVRMKCLQWGEDALWSCPAYNEVRMHCQKCQQLLTDVDRWACARGAHYCPSVGAGAHVPLFHAPRHTHTLMPPPLMPPPLMPPPWCSWACSWRSLSSAALRAPSSAPVDSARI